MMQMLVLWTDGLLFGLLGCVLVAAWRARHSEPVAAAWRRVGANGLGMAALTVLLVFLLIGLLDSLHYRQVLKPAAPGQAVQLSTEVYSALDALLEPLRIHTEKTYSEPLAIRLFSKETVEGADGVQRREFPRLRYGGAHLAYPDADYAGDMAGRLGLGFAMGGGLWLMLSLACTLGVMGARKIAFGVAWRAIWRARGGVNWRAVLLVLGALCLVGGPLAALATGYHVFGTDKVGQDVLYLSLKSIRTALLIGTLTTLVTLPLAVALGVMAGYLGGWVDDVIQYIYTVLNSIPSVLLIAASVLMIQVLIDTHPEWFATAAERSDARLLALCVIMGMSSWTSLCRLLRGETLKLRELEYVQAARAFGVSTRHILARHVLPNLMHLVLIALVMDFSGLVLAEAVLSYVGIGVDASTISFGSMINAARMELSREPMVWWSLCAAFSLMLLLVLSANLFSDVVQEAFDPRQS